MKKFLELTPIWSLSNFLEPWKDTPAGKRAIIIVPVIKRRKKSMYGVHNHIHSGMICSRSISHVSVLDLNMRNYLDMGS